ncbi:sensor histidine kinase [Actinokineospora terrae]|uniref:histidine kinase n=1 Tax=Actinokineospora terrae TaxID=155974 RepID=A0A1H9TAI6_9PSEU|nr:sensor histidine kinase [Actinokineospora terrae]SER93779.1 Signal transduction histidine kinase [Actinokineospora terrae]
MRRRVGWWVDVVVVVVHGVVLGSVLFVQNSPQATFRLSPDGLAAVPARIGLLGVLCLLLSCAAVVMRARWPVIAACLLVVATLPLSSAWLVVVPWALLLYSAAGAGKRVGVVVLVAALATVLVHRHDVVLPGLVLVIAWLVGLVVGGHRAAVAERIRRAEAEAALARQDVVAERLRIARDLHDVIAHGMSVITVQAGYAGLVVDDRPHQARAALDAIETTGRATLVEMRRLLGVLRAEPDDGTGPPGLANLGELVARTQAAGVAVEVVTRGAARDIPAGVDVSAYRIAQEALTNVVKHAATNSCTLTIETTDDELSVAVVDRGRGGPTETGHGLTGMRERAAAHGGTIEAGSVPGGGFAVRARLPLDEVPT